MKFIQIDEEGYFLSSGARLSDEDYGRKLLSSLITDNRHFYAVENGEKILVEAFDDPLVVRHIDHIKRDVVFAVLPYGVAVELPLSSFRVDKWDRFHALTETGVPAVLSRAAQMEFFELADEFDDDSLTFHGVRHEVTPLETTDKSVSAAKFWSETYESNEKPRWDIEGPAEALKSILPQLKLPRSRICVLGSGLGHDAAYLAEQGHVVTAVDFSEAAVRLASEKYTPKTHPTLKFVVADAFQFAKEHRGEFDIVFEHTFFCAIDPARRAELVEAWSRLLVGGASSGAGRGASESGHLLAIFFAMNRNEGPPYGATEWEIRELLKSSFEPLYWTRWRHSIERRLGRELVVYAHKRAGG